MKITHLGETFEFGVGTLTKNPDKCYPNDLKYHKPLIWVNTHRHWYLLKGEYKFPDVCATIVKTKNEDELSKLIENILLLE